jgi:pyruvate dehydrogenase E2 component (dihydrolipoamide acetyltransferase)
MTETIKLPKMDLSMEEGRLQKWLVPTDVQIKKGHVIAEIETDKAVVELEMPQDGVITKFLVQENEKIPVGYPIAELKSTTKFENNVTLTHQDAPIAPIKEAYQIRSIISPAARRRAMELGLDYTNIIGTGPKGRIIYQDLEQAAIKQNKNSSTNVLTSVFNEPNVVQQVVSSEVQPLSNMRRTIARRMLESVNQIPQFTIKNTIDVTKPLQIKQTIQHSLERSGVKISFTDFLVQAVAHALYQHRDLNASFIGDPWDDKCHIEVHSSINIGLAVSTETGLYVPVLHDVQGQSLYEIAKLRTKKIESVRKQTLKATDLQKGTFTISNLGMYEVDEFEAIVNPPEAGILAVGRIRQAPLLIDGKLEFRSVMTLTGTFDHRVVDGSLAAEFMRTLSQYLQSDEWKLI